MNDQIAFDDPGRKKLTVDDFDDVVKPRDEAAEAWAEETTQWSGVPSSRAEEGAQDGND